MIYNKHPASLKIFFATEMWERYGFYVLQSLLAIYLSTYFGFSDELTYSMVGSFTAITYISPIVGGFIADKFIGQKATIQLGAIILLINYLILTAFTSKAFLLLGLAGIAVGTGLLKPNISCLLGNQYPKDSKFKDSGFTIFYMGITSGIIIGTTLPNLLRSHLGWGSCFFSASLGLLFALIIFRIGIKKYQIKDYTQSNMLNSQVFASVFLFIMALWTIAYLILQSADFASFVFIVVACYSTYYLIATARKEPLGQRSRTFSILLLSIISIFFWSFYFQMFLSLTLFITRTVTPQIGHINFPAPYYVGLQSLGIILFGTILSKLWSHLKQRNVINSIVNKFLSALCFLLRAYLIIIYAIYSSPALQLVSPYLIMIAYLLISVAELLLSPVGLSAITSLASPAKVSTMMGIFFVSLGLGGQISGYLARISAIDGKNLSILAYKQSYLNAFIIISSILALCLIASYFISKLLKQMNKEQRVTNSTKLYGDSQICPNTI